MKNCKFCDKDGTAWVYPLLQAVVTSAHPSELAALPPLPAALGAGVAGIALSARARYAVRRVRSGYLYLLTERLGHRYWRSYQVLEDSFLYEFDAERPPLAPVNFSCERNACGVGASVIGIERVDSVEQAWLLFTPDPMTPARLDDYRQNAPAYASEGKLTAFDARAWAAGRRTQPHTMAPEQLMTTAAEFILFRQHEAALTSPLGQAMRALLHPPGSDAYAGTPAQADGSERGFLGVLAQQLARHQAAVLVLADPIGITQALNDFRNEAIDRMRPWLQAVDGATGVTNERKLHVLGALDDVGAALQAGVVARETEAIAQHRTSSDASFQRRLDQARAMRLQGLTKEAQAIEADVERSRTARQANYQRALGEARADAPQAWARYANARRLPGMEAFRTRLRGEAARCDDGLLLRVDDHLAWLQSPQLLAALHAYDPQQVISGEALQGQIGLAMLGLTYTEAGMTLVMHWARQPRVTPGNLLLRAYCLNQQPITQALETSLAAAVQVTHPPETWLAWWRTLDDIQGAMKHTIDAFDKANAALELAPPGQHSPLASMGAVVYSAMGQAVFKLGLDGQESRLGQRYVGMLAASLGRLNARVRLSELAHAGTPLQASQQAALTADARQRVRDAIAQEITHGKAGDAYKIRAAGVIGLIEGLGLLVRCKLPSKGEEGAARKTLEIVGGGMALVAAGFEMFAIGIEFTQKRYRSVTMSSRGAGVALGGIKLFAGALAGAAGAVGAVYDFVDAGKALERGKFPLFATLLTRGLAQSSLAILGGVIGYSFSGPLFEFVATRARSQLGQAVTQGLARGAYWLARPAAGAAVARVALLVRVAASITWVSVGVSLLVFVFSDDELEEWCDKSSFRPHPTPGGGFANEGDELEALYRAFGEVR